MLYFIVNLPLNIACKKLNTMNIIVLSTHFPAQMLKFNIYTLIQYDIRDALIIISVFGKKKKQKTNYQ